jgi:hypothetical protein
VLSVDNLKQQKRRTYEKEVIFYDRDTDYLFCRSFFSCPKLGAERG